MTPHDVEAFFGSKQAIAEALGCKLSSVYEWFHDKRGVPQGRQYQIELATGGALRATKPALRIEAGS